MTLLVSVKCSNIRTVSIAIHYLAIIYLNNKDKFQLSPASAISYFISLLASLILVEHHRKSDVDRKIILNPSADNALHLKEKLGMKHYEANGEIRPLSDEERIIEHLIHVAFYQTNEIKLQGKFSIITYGFYRTDDFEEEFSEWKKTEDYEYYLDIFKYWYLDDEEASRIFSSTVNAMFEEKSITRPSILLLLTDRLTCEIKRGVVNLDFDKTKSKIRRLFAELYDQKKMECVRSIDLHYGNNRFEYCEDIYSEIIEKNKEYYESNEEIDLSKFWVKLKDNPDKLDELMDKYKYYGIFAQYDKSEEIVDVIETLQNYQLFEFIRWMGARINEEPECIEAVNNEHDRAQAVAATLEKKYSGQFGVKAGHIKQIAKILKNKRTDYDPEHIDNNKKIKT